MATRFRKSKKIGPVRVSVGKKSAGISVGGKVAGVSVNTKTGARARVSVPGTGVSYTEKITSGGATVPKSAPAVSKAPAKKKIWPLVLGILFLISGLVAVAGDAPGGAGCLLIGAVLLVVYFAWKKPSPASSADANAADAVSCKPPEVPVTADSPDRTAGSELFNEELDAIPRVDVIREVPHCKRKSPDDMSEVHLTNITRQTNMEKFFPIVVLDTETTGIGAATNRIVELSAIKLDAGFVPASCFTTLVNPEQPIPADAEAVHHISDEMVADAPTFPEIASGFADYISGCKIVGHNVKFDLEFLYAAGLELPPKAKYYDTLDLAKKVLTSPHRRMKYSKEAGGMIESDGYDVENYKLTTLCDYYGIYRNDAHRSLSDCLATAKVLKKLVEAKIGEA